MLIGHSTKGEIEFFFTDDNYLKQKFPNNSAKISNFLKFDHKLKELFINNFEDLGNIKSYKIVNGKIIKKSEKELQLMKKQTERKGQMEIHKIDSKSTFASTGNPIKEVKTNVSRY